MSDTEIYQVEVILRKMDCYYYCGIRDEITVLHAQDEMFTSPLGWKQCCESSSNNLSPSEAYKQLRELSCRVSGLQGNSTILTSLPSNEMPEFGKQQQPSYEIEDQHSERQEPNALDWNEPARFAPLEEMIAENLVEEPNVDLLVNAIDSILLESFIISIVLLMVVAICRRQKRKKELHNE
jgi:hypothetical protein